ncbi:MAG: M20/M25/M40 family metallo-hydrolase [Proteobacteria bacterium]|nr:M20/M25/M40 family metallo-hydrolase [Pseudomonadota bacterium]
MRAHEAVALLCRYLRINTANPPGKEKDAAEFFADIFDHEGIEYKFYEANPGRVSIRAVLRGSGKKGAIILLNHMDVVPANPAEWSFDPFGGEIREGYICGRGALDMKGLGIMELMAFLAMKRNRVKLDRDLIFLAVADEEALGYQGVKYLLEKYPEEFKADLIINEGGFGISDLLATGPLIMIASAEKGPCWLTLTRRGQPGHASMPHGDNTLEKMIVALNRLISHPQPVRIIPLVAEYFRTISSGMEILKPFSDDGKEATLIRILEESGLINSPQISAMVRNTISMTMLTAGIKTNVIPEMTTAELDIRLLPGQDVDGMIDRVKAVLADSRIEIDRSRATGASESPIDSPYFDIIGKVMRESFPGSVVAPQLMTGTSDSRYFRERGVPAYGVFPVLIPMNHLSKVHGIDEMISVDNLVRGSEIMTEIVRRLFSLHEEIKNLGK